LATLDGNGYWDIMVLSGLRHLLVRCYQNYKNETCFHIFWS